MMSSKRFSKIMGLCLVALLLSGVLMPLQRASAQDKSGLLAQINSLRGSLGLHPYQMSNALNAAAQSHSEWMATTGIIAHDEDNGSSPQSRASSAGYGGRFVYENIYGGLNAGTQDAMNWWIASPIHYASLTHPDKTEVGIGIAGDGDGVIYYTVMFGEGELSALPVEPIVIEQATAPENNPVQDAQEAPAEAQNAAPPPPTNPPQPTRPPITFTPSPTIPTATPTVTWTPTATWTPSPTVTAPPPTTTAIVLVAAAPMTTPTLKTVELSPLRNEEVAIDNTPSSPNRVVETTIPSEDSGFNWRMLLPVLIGAQVAGIGWVLWRLWGKHS